MFAQETSQNFTDYETALGDLEKRLPNIDSEPIGTSINDIDEMTNVLDIGDLKNLIKEEFANNQ
jgi:hypothetical protein